MNETRSARQWLGRARSIDREIQSLEEALRQEMDRVTNITPGYHSTGGGGGTKDPHAFDFMAELSSSIDAKIAELRKAKLEITNTIHTIGDARQRTVLLDYYVRGMTLEEIAVEMHYSYAQIKRFRIRGIEAVQVILGKKEKDELE